MHLDCNTPRGREYTDKQGVIATRFAAVKECEVVMTDKKTYAVIDAIFFREFIEAIAEIKAREMTLDGLRGFGSYLITYDKLVKGREIAMMLRVHFLVIAGLTDGRIVHWLICDPDGEKKTNFVVKRTVTQATCNGGEAERENAYLSLSGMKIIEPAEIEYELPF